MSPFQLLYSILSFCTFGNRIPFLLEFSNDQHDKYDTLLSNYEADFGEGVIGFQKETSRLVELLCYLAAQGSGGLVVIAGDKVEVKSKMISSSKKVWKDIHKSTDLNDRTINMDRYANNACDLSMFSNRLIKSGILHLRNVDPNAMFLKPVFERLNTLVEDNKLLCIIELMPENIKETSKLCGIPVPVCLCFTKPNTQQLEKKIQESWVETARQHGLNTSLTDEELLKAIGCVSRDCTLDKLNDVMLFLTEMREKQEPAEKKRRVDGPSTASPSVGPSTSSSSVSISSCGNDSSTTSTDSNNNTTSDNNNTSNSQNNSTIGDRSGNSFVPPSRVVSVDNIARNFLQELPKNYKPLRSKEFAIPEECETIPEKNVLQNVLNMVSNVPPETADLIPHAPSRSIAKSVLKYARDNADKANKEEKEDRKRKRDTEDL